MSSSSYSSWSKMLITAALVGFASAAPVAEMNKRAVDADVFDQLEFFSQYSAAAYCGGNNNSPNTKITCPEGNCARVEQANTTTLSEFENSIKTDVTGFVATDTTNKLIVISFRGSRSVRNFLTDVVFPTTETEICADCEASKGFVESFEEARASVLDAVALAQSQFPDFRVVSTGHSLGGALAAIAAGVLRSQGTTVDLFTYGAPKVGLEAISAELSRTDLGSNFRVTHKHDPVPRLPPAFLGFKHITPEFYIESGNDNQPTPGDIQVFEDQLDKNGNEGDFLISISAHLFYFGRIADCDGETKLEIRKRDFEDFGLM